MHNDRIDVGASVPSHTTSILTDVQFFLPGLTALQVSGGNIIAFEAVFYKFNSRIEDSLCRLHSR